MRQVEYRGYARGQGFNPIQVPDSTRKIAERDQAYIQGMQRYASQLEANRRDYAQGMQRKFATEEQNRRDNFQWQEREAERYQNAVLRNIEVERENAARAAQFVGQDKSTLQALSGLSKQISEGLIAYDKKLSVDQEAEGKSLVVENGLTPDVITRYQQQKAALAQSDQRINAVANQLDFEGVPVSIIEQYLGLSGWRKVGATAAMAKQGADYYPAFILQAKDSQEFDIGNGPFTLATARNMTEYRYAETALRTQYLKNFSGISDPLLNEYLYPGMRQFEANERAQFANQYEKSIQNRIQGERVSDLMTNAKATGGAGFLDWVNRVSGGDRNLIGETRRQGFDAIAKAIESGQMTPGEWEAIKDFEFTPRGQSKPVTIGEYYGGEASVVDNAVAKKQREVYEQQQMDRQMANEEFDGIVREALFGATPPTEEDLKQIEEQYNRNGFRIPEFFKSYRSQEDKNKEAKREQLRYYANLDALDTETLFRVAQGDQELISEFKRNANDGDQLRNIDKSKVDESLGILEARLAEYLEQIGTDKKTSSAMLIGKQRIEREFTRKLNLELRQHGDPNLAIEQAQNYVSTLLYDGIGAEESKRKGPFHVPGNRLNSTNPFKNMGGNAEFNEVSRRINSLQPGTWRTQVVLKPNEIAAVERFRDGKGEIPSVVIQMARKTGQNPIDLMDAQLNLAGKKLLVPVQSELVRRSMSPQMQKILTYRPSAGNTYQAFGMNPGDGLQPWKDLLDLIASKESTAYGGYDAMNTGGSNGGHTPRGSANSRNVFPGGLTSMTVAQVMDLQRQGRLHAAGRYQIINDPKNAPTLSRLMQGKYGPTGVDLNDKFDAATQDKLAIALIRGRAGKFFSGTGRLDDAVTGMGQEWLGLQRLPRQRIAELLTTTRTLLNSPSPFRQPEAMRMNVLSSIGSQVSSIRKETPGNSFQPGFDLFFEDKKFKALLPGRVKEIGREGNYGNYVVIESKDPKTGELVDVLYAHIADGSINVREGDVVNPGQQFAQQGGTGRVRSADGTIASVDFLAPAPRGSKSMTPYKRWSQLVDEITAGLRKRS